MAIDRIHSFQCSIPLIGGVADANAVLYIEPFGYDLHLSKGRNKRDEWNNNKKTDQSGVHWSALNLWEKYEKCTLYTKVELHGSKGSGWRLLEVIDRCLDVGVLSLQ